MGTDQAQTVTPQRARITRRGRWVFRGLWLGTALLLLLFTLAFAAWVQFLRDETVARLVVQAQTRLESLAEARNIYTHFLDTSARLLQEPAHVADAASAAQWAATLDQIAPGHAGLVRIEPASTPLLLLRSVGAPALDAAEARTIARLHLISRVSFPGNADGYVAWLSPDAASAVLFAKPEVMQRLASQPLAVDAVLQHLARSVHAAQLAQADSETRVLRDDISGDSVIRRITPLHNATGEPGGVLIGNRLLSLMPLQLRASLNEHAVAGRLILAAPGMPAPALLFDPDATLHPASARLLARDGPLLAAPGYAWQAGRIWVGARTLAPAWQGVAAFDAQQVIRAQALPLAAGLLLYLSAAGLIVLAARWVGRRVLLPDLRAQHAIETARRAAEAANTAKSSFLASISHEIRTPLFGMLGTLELLERSALQPEQLAQLAMARTSSTALMQIIDDLLDFSRIEAGAMPVQLAPFDLNALLDSTLDGYQALALQKDLALRRDYHADLPSVVSDAVRLRQILANLIANALKFTAHGSVTVSARVIPLQAERARLRLAVRDTGIGIDASTAARLFQPFQQAEANPASRFAGTGLGLSISQRLARLLGGQITLQSVPGQGSSFSLQLEVATAAPVSAEAAPPASARQFAAHVLVADDHPVNQQVLLQQLQALGCSAEAVSDGQQALQRLQAEDHFDLLLTDFNMPVLDGLALTQQLRAQGQTLPVIGITASLLQGEIERGQRSGMTLCLAKPVLLPTLAAALAQLQLPAAAPSPQHRAPTPVDLTQLRVQTLQADLAALKQALVSLDPGKVKALAHRIRGAFVQAPAGEDIADASAQLEASATRAVDELGVHGAATVAYAELWLEEHAAAAPRTS